MFLGLQISTRTLDLIWSNGIPVCETVAYALEMSLDGFEVMSASEVTGRLIHLR
jgi:hypothetical protein